MKPAAFLFDLDGTLVDTEALWTKAIVDFVVSRGGRTTYEEILPTVIGRNWLDIDRSLHERFPEIGYVGVCATGYNVVDIKAAREHGVVVTNIPAYSTDSVVQMTWAFILNLASRVEMHDLSVKQGDWTRSDTFCYWLDSPIELFGKSLGIYGFGNIGRGVAKVGQALGMKILVYTKHPERFWEGSNQNLKCINCKDKTCQYKKQYQKR